MHVTSGLSRVYLDLLAEIETPSMYPSDLLTILEALVIELAL